MTVDTDELLRSSVRKAFDKKAPVTNFLSNLFEPEELTTTKVTLHGRAVKAIYSEDVVPGTDGNRIELSNFEETEYEIPEYNDYGTVAAVDLAKQQFGESRFSEKVAYAANMIAEKQIWASDMQKRAEEKQAADALLYGRITLKSGKKIDFKKPATHDVDKSSAKWNTDKGDPVADIGNACSLIKSDAKLAGGEYHAIMGELAYNALIASGKLKANSNWNNGITLNDIKFPEEMAGGANFHGRLVANGKIINIWTYDAEYVIPDGLANAGAKVGYIPAGAVIIVPAKRTFKRYYGANASVPNNYKNFLTDPVQLVKSQQYFYEYAILGGGNCFVEAGCKSRPLHVPTDPNEIATLKNVI